MASDKTDIDHFDFEQYQCNQAILISPDVKNNPVITNIIRRIESPPDISKTIPIRIHSLYIPVTQSRFGILVRCRETDQVECLPAVAN